MDATEYIPENLNETDAKIVQGMEELCNEVLCRESIDDFLQENEHIGKEQGKLMKEWILPYLEYLREACTRFVVNKMVDCIDGYSEEEFQQIKSKRKLA